MRSHADRGHAGLSPRCAQNQRDRNKTDRHRQRRLDAAQNFSGRGNVLRTCHGKNSSEIQSAARYAIRFAAATRPYKKPVDRS